jgi:tryptophan-rich sensory protein
MRFRPIPATLVFLVLNFAALGIGAYFMGEGPQGDWYQNLNKAPWTPPGWVFGASWTTIMICFAIFMGLAWRGVANQKRLAVLYAIQWVLNVAWNPVFFGWKAMGIALVLIAALTLLVWYFILGYRRELGYQVLLVAPYGIWLVIATSLNAYALWMN